MPRKRKLSADAGEPETAKAGSSAKASAADPGPKASSFAFVRWPQGFVCGFVWECQRTLVGRCYLIASSELSPLLLDQGFS